MTAVGQSEPTSTPGVFRIVEIQTVTGGTGRFSGAKGSFTVERLIDLTTGLTSGSFHGTITSQVPPAEKMQSPRGETAPGMGSPTPFLRPLGAEPLP